MVIQVRDLVPHCRSWADGDVIGCEIKRALDDDKRAIISFDGVDDVPSSFVNAAFVSLLDKYSLHFIKHHVIVRNSTAQINSLIKRRLSSEAVKNLSVA
jgi:hypothetical protein